jgi:hypothetical protein
MGSGFRSRWSILLTIEDLPPNLGSSKAASVSIGNLSTLRNGVRSTPTTDMAEHRFDVRKVPKADMHNVTVSFARAH